MKKASLILVLFTSFLDIKAQKRSEKNFGSWYMIYANHTISNKLSILTGFEERNYQTFQNYNLVLFNIGVNYKLSNSFKATVSYMYLDIDRTFDLDLVPNTIEHRHYEQLNYSTKYFNITFSHRLRIEHRHLYSHENYTLINRIRYRLKARLPIKKNFYLTASNESFLNFKGNFYAENRFCAALGLETTKNISLEVGYLSHYINELHLNRLQVGLFLKTDFRKKTTP